MSTKAIVVGCSRILQLSFCRTLKTIPLASEPKKVLPSLKSKIQTLKRPAKDFAQRHELDARWSITAYNLSEELKIDNVKKLVENFEDYELEDIDRDIQDEAVILRRRPSASAEDDQDSSKYAEKPLNDVFLFREGSVVFWGVPYEEQKRFVYRLSPLKVNPLSQDLIQEEKEYLNYTYTSSDKSRLARDVVKLANKQELRSRLLDQFAFSHAMAMSCKLGVWECMLDTYIESVDWITENMKNGQKLRLTRDQVFRKTGEIYELKHVINLSSDLLDLPDVYWDRHDQEMMYASLISFLNIKRRTTVMNEKLNHCCELMNLLANHMNDKHHLRLEWMIIVLITVEVLFEIAKFL